MSILINAKLHIFAHSTKFLKNILCFFFFGCHILHFGWHINPFGWQIGFRFSKSDIYLPVFNLLTVCLLNEVMADMSLFLSKTFPN